jgi:hypothetical protein
MAWWKASGGREPGQLLCVDVRKAEKLFLSSA